MSAITSQTYAATLEAARIAALNALTDILRTSDDPTERRHAATAILRAPEPSRQTDSPQEEAMEGVINPNAIVPGTDMTIAQVINGAKRVLQKEHEGATEDLYKSFFGDQPATASRRKPTPQPASPTPASKLAAAAGTTG